MINTKNIKRLEEVILKRSIDLTDIEYRLATQILLLLTFEGNEKLDIYIDEIVNGIDFFTNENKRIVLSNGVKIKKEEVSKILKALKEKGILDFKDEAYGLLRVW